MVPSLDSVVGSPKEKLSISIGLSVFDSDSKIKRELVEFADAALYAAKRKGRNTVVKHCEVVTQKRALEAT
jgi:GGDEF domain-containing protein